MIALLSQGFEDAKRIASHRTYWTSYLNFITKMVPTPPLNLTATPIRTSLQIPWDDGRDSKYLTSLLANPTASADATKNRMCKKFLAGTDYVVSNSLRKRSIPINLKYEERLEVRRRLALRLFHHKRNTRLMPSFRGRF